MSELQAAIKRARIGHTFPKYSNTPSIIAHAVDPPEPETKYPKVIAIKRAVADYFSVEMIDLDSQRKDGYLVHARHLAMYLCRTMTLHSYPEIGRRMGNRDHATVMHAVRKIENLIGGGTKRGIQVQGQIDDLRGTILP